MNADRMLKTKDPYSSIFAPPATPERVQAGHQLFNEQCAACHGQDATGGMAPNLTKGEFAHGASDWGLYRTITHGIPGTPIQARNLPVETLLATSCLQRREANSCESDPYNVLFWFSESSLQLPGLFQMYSLTAVIFASPRKILS